MSLSRQMIDAVVMAITIVGLPWARAAFRPPKTIQSRLRRRETTDIYAARGARRNSGCPLARTTAVRVPPLSERGVHAMPVVRAAYFATRLSPAPVFRIVRFADFTTFVVLDFLRLAILFPPVRYLVGSSPRPLCHSPHQSASSWLDSGHDAADQPPFRRKRRRRRVRRP
jgi:hypothetical protein